MSDTCDLVNKYVTIYINKHMVNKIMNDACCMVFMSQQFYESRIIYSIGSKTFISLYLVD